MSGEVARCLVEIVGRVAATAKKVGVVEFAAAETRGEGGELEASVANTLKQAPRARRARVRGGRVLDQRGRFGLGVEIIRCEAWTATLQSHGLTAVDALAGASGAGDHALTTLSAADYSAEEAARRSSGISARNEQADLDERGLV